MSTKIDIYVYAHWKGMPEPKLIGTLSIHFAKAKKAFSFEYSDDWLKSEQKFLLIRYSIIQRDSIPKQRENFGVFLDSMPDT